MPQNETLYSIPVSFRRMENLHIFFWLFKDISWCMVWKPLGIIMIFPTLIIAVIIAIRTRHMVSELCHNAAIVLWITANSYWMIAEFLHFDEDIITSNITYKHLAVIPFAIGIIIMLYYYLWWKPRNKEIVESM
jgi:hypothetical protein